MVETDKRYVKKLTFLVSFGVTVLVGIFCMIYSKGYTNKAIMTEREITKAYVDSVFDGKFIPKLDVIINQQDTIIQMLRNENK